MDANPALSLIVPTRHRVAQARCFLDSLALTTSRPEEIEVILVVDEDDPASANLTHPVIKTRSRSVSPGRTMGQLNRAGAEAAFGEFLMLLNDDVVVRTPGWDIEVLGWLRRFRDGIVLVHVNDTLMREHLCTFPIVSRVFCEMAGGICPEQFQRYRIDDHIQDIFIRLGNLGERRMVYLPRVVFEHLHGTQMPEGHLEYHADPKTLARDAPVFDRLQEERQAIACRLLDHVKKRRGQPVQLGVQATKYASDSPLPVGEAARLRVEPFQPGLSPDSLAVLLLDRDGTSGGRLKESLTSVRRHARGAETIVVTSAGVPLVDLLRMVAWQTRADYILVLLEGTLLTRNSLETLLSAMSHHVGLVFPNHASGEGPAGFLIDRNHCFVLPPGECEHADWSETHLMEWVQEVRSTGLETAWVDGSCLHRAGTSWRKWVSARLSRVPSGTRMVRGDQEGLSPLRDSGKPSRDNYQHLYWVGPPKRVGFPRRLWNCFRQGGWKGFLGAAQRRLNHLFGLS